MIELILARHGQTVWNKEGRFQGWKDTPLTSKGIKQAKKVAKLLLEKKIDFIFCSDLSRARQTAAFIIKQHPEAVVKFVKELRELSFGILEGKTWEEASDDVPNIFEIETKDKFFIPHPHGESFDQLNKRVGGFLKKVLKLQDKTVLIVSHDGVGRSVLQNLFKLSFKEKAKICHPHEIVYFIKVPEQGSKNCHWINIETGKKGKGFYKKSGI